MASWQIEDARLSSVSDKLEKFNPAFQVKLYPVFKPEGKKKKKKIQGIFKMSSQTSMTNRLRLFNSSVFSPSEIIIRFESCFLTFKVTPVVRKEVCDCSEMEPSIQIYIAPTRPSSGQSSLCTIVTITSWHSARALPVLVRLGYTQQWGMGPVFNLNIENRLIQSTSCVTL